MATTSGKCHNQSKLGIHSVVTLRLTWANTWLQSLALLALVMTGTAGAAEALKVSLQPCCAPIHYTDMSIDRQRLKALIEQEEATYLRAHPKSHALYQEARTCLLAGVPMHWM